MRKATCCKCQWLLEAEAFAEDWQCDLNDNGGEYISMIYECPECEDVDYDAVDLYLMSELEDDGQPHGGISHVGETVEEFLLEAGYDYDVPLGMFNQTLRECGIKPVQSNGEYPPREDDVVEEAVCNTDHLARKVTADWELSSKIFNTPNGAGYVSSWWVRITEGTFNSDKLIIEFYSLDTEQFVADYYVDTFLGRDSMGRGYGGLDLWGDVPSWKIEEHYADQIREWAAYEVDRA